MKSPGMASKTIRPQRVRIVVADESTVAREGIAAIIRQELGYCLCGVVDLKKSLLGCVLGLTALTCGLCAYAGTLAPAPTVLPILSPGGAYAATDLVAKVQCSETHMGKAIAKLNWTVATAPGSQQRIDITMYWDGFERGNFETSGPHPPGQSFVELERLEPGINYYWRVLTLTPKGWVPSATARCKVPVCPGGDEPQAR